MTAEAATEAEETVEAVKMHATAEVATAATVAVATVAVATAAADAGSGMAAEV